MAELGLWGSALRASRYLAPLQQRFRRFACVRSHPRARHRSPDLGRHGRLRLRRGADVDRLSRRSDAALRREPPGPALQGEALERDRRPNACRMAECCAEPPEQCYEPVPSKGYRFDDLDEFVRNAQVRGLEVLITLWGTPKWANKNKGPNYLPTKPRRLPEFCARSRLPLLRPLRRLPVRPLLRDLERVEPGPPSSRRNSTPRGRSSARRRTPSSPRQATPASRRDSKTLVAIGETSSQRPRQVKRKGATRLDATRHFRRSSWLRRTRSSSSTPGCSIRSPFPSIRGRTRRCVIRSLHRLPARWRSSRRTSTSGSGGRTSRCGLPSMETRRSPASQRA